MSRPAKRTLKFDTTNDRLAAYFGGTIEKTDLKRKELNLSQRILGIWSILTNMDDPSTTTEAINKHVLANEGMCIGTAYRDLRRATRIFGDLGQISLQARWLILHDLGMKMLKLAIVGKDLREANKAVKNLIDITLNLKGDEMLDEKTGKYVLQIYIKGNEAPREINLDDAANITDIEFEELKTSVEGVIISDVDVRKMLEEENEGKEA